MVGTKRVQAVNRGKRCGLRLAAGCGHIPHPFFFSFESLELLPISGWKLRAVTQAPMQPLRERQHLKAGGGKHFRSTELLKVIPPKVIPSKAIPPWNYSKPKAPGCAAVPRAQQQCSCCKEE